MPPLIASGRCCRCASVRSRASGRNRRSAQTPARLQAPACWDMCPGNGGSVEATTMTQFPGGSTAPRPLGGVGECVQKPGQEKKQCTQSVCGAFAVFFEKHGPFFFVHKLFFCFSKRQTPLSTSSLPSSLLTFYYTRTQLHHPPLLGLTYDSIPFLPPMYTQPPTRAPSS